MERRTDPQLHLPLRLTLIITLLPLLGSAHAQFEARQLHPLELTSDGSRLLAVNAAGAFLSVFDPGTASRPAPVLLAEIPVGLEPVTVRARGNDEAWVVNEVSDSISVVDLTRRQVVATLSVPDEPADVVFSGNRAFVACGRANRIAVFDVETRTEIGSIPLSGNFPRALSLSPDGSRLCVAFLLSGNNTTTLHFRDAPPQPAPANPALPAPPRTGLIVADTDPRISYDVLDHDVAEIDPGTLQVIRYHPGLGTNLFALAHAADGSLWAAASEARNLIRFEPALNGIFAESRVARIPVSGAPNIIDLNPAATAAVIPAFEKEQSLAQPMALLPAGDSLWLAAFGSDRIAELDASGTILHRSDLRGSGNPDTVRGPRGLAKSDSLDRLFVFNKLSDTLSVVDLSTRAVVAEVAIASHDPIPAGQRRGRGFFFDSRRSGNGTVSCGACHFDADNDGIAWDLGDPGGEMLTLTGYNLSLGSNQAVARPVHPMKGPMVTQSLCGIGQAGPFHWRGDKQDLREFNASFEKLQAGNQLAAADMDQVAAYLESLSNHPNPNRQLDDTLKTSVAGANPVLGRQHFFRHQVCSKCHAEPRGTNHVIDEFEIVLTTQPVKNSTLEHIYRKTGFTPDQAVSLSGFGFTHDGSGHDLPRGHEYDLDTFDRSPTAEADVMAYILSTSTGTAPAVGKDLILRPGDPDPAAVRATLESQAALGKCDLVMRGTLGGISVTYLYQPASSSWQPATAELPLGFAEIHTAMVPGDSLMLLGVPPGCGPLFSIDRDRDGIPNDAETFPALDLQLDPPRLHWPAAAADWIPEHSTDLLHWHPCPLPAAGTPDSPFTIEPLPPGPFYRLRRTW